jgi:glycosyltransferase involved in cell wall biosynthesis
MPVVYFVVPCYNEEEVLPETIKRLTIKLFKLIESGRASKQSRMLFVDDGSKDKTWELIEQFGKENKFVGGIKLSRNRGHQNAVLAGLMEAEEQADITISIDCDGQDDITAMERMVDAYQGGAEVVYGVRSSRATDTWFKRTTAQGFYKFLNLMGAEVVYNHADYRLVSARVLRHFADFHEVNIFLRGMFPLVGFKSTCVAYERHERLAGESHYPLHKMLALAIDGITSLSTKPITLIGEVGFVISLLGFLGILWAIGDAILHQTVPGWASIVCIVCFLGGIQLLSLGVIGEYVGKTYMESKHRPRYIISERTEDAVQGH